MKGNDIQTIETFEECKKLIETGNLKKLKKALWGPYYRSDFRNKLIKEAVLRLQPDIVAWLIFGIREELKLEEMYEIKIQPKFLNDLLTIIEDYKRIRPLNANLPNLSITNDMTIENLYIKEPLTKNPSIKEEHAKCTAICNLLLKKFCDNNIDKANVIVNLIHHFNKYLPQESEEYQDFVNYLTHQLINRCTSFPNDPINCIALLDILFSVVPEKISKNLINQFQKKDTVFKFTPDDVVFYFTTTPHSIDEKMIFAYDETFMETTKKLSDSIQDLLKPILIIVMALNTEQKNAITNNLAFDNKPDIVWLKLHLKLSELTSIKQVLNCELTKDDSSIIKFEKTMLACQNLCDYLQNFIDTHKDFPFSITKHHDLNIQNFRPVIDEIREKMQLAFEESPLISTLFTVNLNDQTSALTIVDPNTLIILKVALKKQKLEEEKNQKMILKEKKNKETLAQQSMFKLQYEQAAKKLNKVVDPIYKQTWLPESKDWEYSQLIGATIVCRLFSTDNVAENDAKQKNKLAYIELNESGLLIYFLPKNNAPEHQALYDNLYAALSHIFPKKNISSGKGIKTSHGTYERHVHITTHVNVIQFLKAICNYQPEFIQRYYEITLNALLKESVCEVISYASRAITLPWPRGKTITIYPPKTKTTRVATTAAEIWKNLEDSNYQKAQELIDNAPLEVTETRTEGIVYCYKQLKFVKSVIDKIKEVVDAELIQPKELNQAASFPTTNANTSFNPANTSTSSPQLFSPPTTPPPKPPERSDSESVTAPIPPKPPKPFGPNDDL